MTYDMTVFQFLSISTEGDLIGKTWKFESVHCKNHFIHQTSNNQVTYPQIGRNRERLRCSQGKNNQNSDSDSLWYVVHGLCGRGISFQSKKHPDRYICGEKNQVYTQVYGGSEQMKEDACFLVKRDSHHDLSFESVSKPNHFLKCTRNDFIKASVINNIPGKQLWKPVPVE